MTRLRLAIGFLTVLPIGSRHEARDEDLGGSVLWFPLVGLLIGAGLVGAQIALSTIFPPLVVGAGLLLCWVGITGALHLDGVGDVCDGFYAGEGPRERLRIMKDPHVGAMAVVGIALVLVLKFALLASLPVAALRRALFLIPCLARYAMVGLSTSMAYARAEGGTAAPFVHHGTIRSLVGATAMALPASWFIWGPTGLALFGLVIVGIFSARAIFQRALGGITGDALGATGEVMEVLLLAGAALSSA